MLDSDLPLWSHDSPFHPVPHSPNLLNFTTIKGNAIAFCGSQRMTFLKCEKRRSQMNVTGCSNSVSWFTLSQYSGTCRDVV
uniref:Uncharacterized protein n=1 Tax=Anguilla anguilla TaxID=7936 RepID=A0A0E9X2L1_ANGAN